MTIAFRQQADFRSTGTTCDVTITPLAGSLVVFNCMGLYATNRTLTVTDTTNGDAVSEAVAEVRATAANNPEVAVDYIPSVTGGSTTYRLTASGTVTAIELDVFEFTHDGTATFDVGSYGDNPAGTSFVCALAGEIDTAPNAVVTCCHQWNGTLGGGSNPSGYTMSTLAGNTRSGYKGPGTYTDENAAQTTVTSRYGIGAVASFAEVGGGPTYNYQNALLTMGVGA